MCTLFESPDLCTLKRLQCIFSKSFSEHIEHLLIAFDRLIQANLKLNWEKCQFFQTTLHILGHVVSNNQIMMDPKKVAAILEMKPPKNTKQIHTSMGIFGYYRRYVKDFAAIAKPLYSLLKKNVKWCWQTDSANAFDKLKEVLTKFPILRPPNFALKFYLYTDASMYALGCVLGQTEGEFEYVILYASRLLQGAEIHYGITEKECLGVVWALKLCHHYIYGMQVTIITDHSALKWLLYTPEPTGRLARWMLYIQMYSSEIVHRKGTLHNNVDPLSRPILSATTRSHSKGIIHSDAPEKFLDPHEDTNLLHYLEFHKHRQGLSKNCCKRIEKQSKNFSLEDKKLWYITDSKKLEYPELKDRDSIVESAHLLGHFQAESTFNRLKDRYYWKKMMDDIYRVIRNFETCKRFEHSKVVNHPAKALPITGLFDRVGIDLIFGLQETSEGYRGILIITEYLSKYPYATPITTKSAPEIAVKLFEYISFFGPPKELLSDQGREFLNSVVAELSLICGIERKVTAAYNPRTNGLTEHFGGTLIAALRKHVENEPTNWPAWLPFILLSYRTRVHSVTQQTPIALLIGKEANQFNSWIGEPSNEEVEILQRATELKQLVEEKRPQTIEKLAQAQISQRKRQDRQANVDESFLTVGTTVYIKSMKLQNKMAPLYHGPYSVVKRDSNDNYQLKTTNNILLPKLFPRSQLKVVAPDNNPVVAFEKILEHQVTRTGTMEYLVQYTGKSINDANWVKESHFTTTDLIETYWESHSDQRKIVSLVRLTDSQNFKLPCIPFWLLLLIFITFFFNYCSCPSLKGPFKFCDSTQKTIVDTRLNCDSDGKFANLSQKSYREYWHILDKQHLKIRGTAYICKQYLVKAETDTGFWGHEYLSMQTIPQKVTIDECKHMVRTKMCGAVRMFCSDSTCSHHENPKPDYKWMRRLTDEKINCILTTTIIKAADETVTLYEGLQGKCKASDLACLMPDGIIIWSTDIIHQCPLEYIESGTFNRRKQILFTHFGVTTNYTSRATHLLFKLEKMETLCNLTGYLTSEGLWLTQSNIQAAKLERAIITPLITQKLALADTDYTQFILDTNTHQVSFEHSQGQCHLLQTILNLIEFHEDTFHYVS